MSKLVLLLSILLLASASSAQNRKSAPAKKPAAKQAVLAGVVADIVVEGNRKLEKDAILNRISVKKGQSVSEKEIREDVLTLFKLDYFDGVEVDRSSTPAGLVLTYRVIEKPSIEEIVYEGNTEVKADDLKEAAGIKQYEILNRGKVREAVEKMQKVYEDKGYFLAKIDAEIVEVKKDETVKVTFKIREGEKVKVKKIIFLGNKKLSDEALKSKMFTSEEGYFTGLSGSGAYKQEAFERDVLILRQIYMNQGYIQVKIERPQVSVSPDKKGIYLTIRIDEGEQFFVGEVEFDVMPDPDGVRRDKLLFSRQELFDAVKIDESNVFAYDVLQKDMAELQAKYGDLGYAYANIVPRHAFVGDNKVNLVFEIDKGNKVYFGRIDVVGNSKTRDKVIRRELKIREGELYNETRRRESLESIQRLGFFDDLNFKTSTPPDALDVMNVEIVVKERNTGQIQVSAGYGTSTGFTFGGSVNQTNFRGLGQNLGISMQLTSNTSMYDLSFTEPAFNDTDWSVGYRVFQSSSTNRLDYDEKRTGGTLTLGYPVAENTRAYLTYGYTAIRLSPVYTTDNAGNLKLLTDYDLFPLTTAEGDASTVAGSVEFDSRNDRLRPTKGFFASGSLENTGGLGGNLHYYKAGAVFRFFRPLFWDVVFRNSLRWQIIGSTNNGKEPPFSELYLLGGPYSLRGYRYGRVGKMSFSRQIFNDLISQGKSTTDARDQAMRFFGGRQQALYQGEFQFPLIREADMFGVAFYDVGQAEDQLSGSKLYSDWGFGLRWFSPIGPLRFEWGFPLNRDPLYHENGVFEFSIGTPF